MISHKYKAIFIHLPKCAGTSIEHAFGHADGYNGRGSQDHRLIREIEPIQFGKINVLQIENLKILRRRYLNKKIVGGNPNNKVMVTPKEYAEYFKFTVVRNPFDRAYSWYKGIMRDPINRSFNNIQSEISFEEFLTRYLHERRLMKPYLHFLRDFGGEVPMDYIGRFENLENDMQEVCRRLKADIKLVHKNDGGGKSQDYRQFYSEKAFEMVKNFYREDLEYFDYSFDK